MSLASLSGSPSICQPCSLPRCCASLGSWDAAVVDFGTGRVAAYASAASASRRRRRRPADPEPTVQQEADLERVTASEPGSRQPNRQHDRVREQLFQQAAGLGLMRASELEALAQEQRTAPAVSLDYHNCDSAPQSSSRGTGASASSGELHMQSTPSSRLQSSRSTSTSDSSQSTCGGRRSSSSSSEEGAEASSSGRRIITEEDEAIIAAMNRISRFMDFRERCAFEVITKLVGLGYEQQFAHKVLKRLQRVVGAWSFLTSLADCIIQVPLRSTRHISPCCQLRSLGGMAYTHYAAASCFCSALFDQ